MPDVSLRTAYALIKQGKRLFSPLDSKAFICLLGAVLFALEEDGSIRFEPAEPVHHGQILARNIPEAKHLIPFYRRAAGRTMLDFFETCTAEGESLSEEKDAFARILSDPEMIRKNEEHLARIQGGKQQDPLLFSLLDVSDLSRAVFTVPVLQQQMDDTLEDTKQRQIEALPLLWVLRYVQ